MCLKELIVLGAGGHGKVVTDIVISRGWSVVGYVDLGFEMGKRMYRGIRIVANSLEELVLSKRETCRDLIVAVGDNKTRRSLFNQALGLGFSMPTVVHPEASLSFGVVLGRGVVVMSGAVINSSVSIGDNSIINTAATVDHDCVIGRHAHISPGANLGGNVVVDEGSHVSIGCSIRDSIRIGKWSVVGAGSVVVKDVSDYAVSFGCPAKTVRFCYD